MSRKIVSQEQQLVLSAGAKESFEKNPLQSALQHEILPDIRASIPFSDLQQIKQGLVVLQRLGLGGQALDKRWHIRNATAKETGSMEKLSLSGGGERGAGKGRDKNHPSSRTTVAPQRTH